MAYATIDDIFGRYRPIRTMVGVSSFEITSLEVASLFVNDAEAFVDAFLGVRWVTPIVQAKTAANGMAGSNEKLTNNPSHAVPPAAAPQTQLRHPAGPARAAKTHMPVASRG